MKKKNEEEKRRKQLHVDEKQFKEQKKDSLIKMKSIEACPDSYPIPR